MIKALALSGLETAISGYLRLDPDTTEKLAKLSDQVIEVVLTDWDDSFFIIPDEDGLQLLAEYNGEVHACIKGKLFNLIRVVKAGSNSRAIFDNALIVEGDTELAEKLRNVLIHIDIDWEEHLSRLVGDSFAHRIAYGVKQILGFSRNAVNTIAENINDYIHAEAHWFPKSDDIEQFYQEIHKLRDDVERAEARIKKLTDAQDSTS